MKRALLAALALFVSLPFSTAKSEETSGKSKPNFVFILGEAHGWSSTSVDMDGAEPSHARPAGLTPHLERIAKDGMRFSEFYVSAPRCTPSRASFFTGISPAKLHMTYVNEGGKERRGSGEDVSDASQRVVPPAPLKELPEEVPTTGALLQRQGYATAHFGKWHIGRIDPTRRGFDESDGPNTNQGPEPGAPNPKECFAITARGEGRRGGGGEPRGEPRGQGRSPRREGGAPPPEPAQPKPEPKPAGGAALALKSASVSTTGQLDVRHTCDGEGSSPPIE